METVDDDQKHPAIPEQRTVFLVNTYIVHTVQLLNKFSALCEQKLAEVHRRILRLDATITLLEAKLRSVEDSEGPGEAASLVLNAEVGSLGGFSSGSERPLETDKETEGILSLLPLGSSEHVLPSPSASSSASEQQSHLKVKDDPSYSRFFRMLQVGVPERAVKMQMSVEGFHPSLLDDPEAPAPGNP